MAALYPLRRRAHEEKEIPQTAQIPRQSRLITSKIGREDKHASVIFLVLFLKDYPRLSAVRSVSSSCQSPDLEVRGFGRAASFRILSFSPLNITLPPHLFHQSSCFISSHAPTTSSSHRSLSHFPPHYFARPSRPERVRSSRHHNFYTPVTALQWPKKNQRTCLSRHRTYDHGFARFDGRQ